MEGTARFPRTDNDRSVGELVNQLSDQTSTLIRQELRLAQTELQEKGMDGRKQVDRGTPPLPQQAIESAKRDVDEISRSAQDTSPRALGRAERLRLGTSRALAAGHARARA